MAENSAQDRTEAPTARKLSKAREDGQVARSVELPAAAVVICAFLALLLSGRWLFTKVGEQMIAAFRFDPRLLSQSEMLPGELARQVVDGLLWIAPLMAFCAAVAVLASGLTGGYLFSLKSLQPRASKISPVEGFKRMFGAHAAVELGKALLKFALVTGILWAFVLVEIDALLALGSMALEPAMGSLGSLLARSALGVSLSLLVIAAIDVPWQRHRFLQRMKMTKQEVRDEMKDVEGRPEVKAHIRQRQRELASARMMRRVRDADVVITNPEHFAVALAYDASSDAPPLVVAKGADLMAHRVREEAELHGVHIFQAPPLARALYFTTDLEKPIPDALYLAVAQVIAYVYSLEGMNPSAGAPRRPDPPVPASMQFDARGQRVATTTEDVR
jgi:flagellar biosynthetic protein FlhB